MRLRELPFVLRKTAAVLRDTTRLGDLLAVAEILNRSTFERIRDDFERTPEGRSLLADRPELSRRTVDLSQLRALPERSLGRAFATHLDAHHLDLDALAVPPPRPDEPAETYLLRRYRGNHDLWHTLLGLGVTVREEVLVNAFSWGQLGLPQNRAIVALGAARHLAGVRNTVETRRLLAEIRRHWRAGRNASPLLTVRWESLWDVDIDEVRRTLRIDLRG